MLAELARIDRHRFRVLVPDSDQTKALRAMTRAFSYFGALARADRFGVEQPTVG